MGVLLESTRYHRNKASYMAIQRDNDVVIVLWRKLESSETSGCSNDGPTLIRAGPDLSQLATKFTCCSILAKKILTRLLCMGGTGGNRKTFENSPVSSSLLCHSSYTTSGHYFS